MIYLLFGLVAAGLAFALSRSIVGTVVNGILGVILSWMFLPTLAFGFWDSTFLVTVFVLGGWAWSLLYMDSYSREPKVSGKVMAIQASVAIGFAVLAMIVVPLATSWSAWHASSYRALLDVEVKDFDTEQQLLDQTQARFVDQALAKRSAEELLGNQQGLGSKVDVGTMSIQSVKGRLWWVAPLEHKDIFKWMSNGTTPGYVMVSASDYSDSRIVLGKFELSIGMGGNFGDYLPRYMYQNGFASRGYMDYTFELNDQEQPFWVVTLFEKKVGYGGEVATGVVVVDPVTGDINEYGIDDAPAWIDRIQPESIVENRISDWGVYVEGWLNSWTSGNNVIKASQGTSLVYTADGHSAWYTGLQSKGSSDQGTMGFMLVDTRTGKASFYRRAGITEAAAKEVIEGQVQEKGYTSTWPIPYLVNGQPTFISVLKDQAGNTQMIGMVSYNDRTVMGVGKELRTTLREYTAALRSKGTSLAIDGEVELQTFEGTIIRIGKEQLKESALITIMLDTVDNKAFSVPSHLSPEVLLSKEGDSVRVSALNTGNGVIDVDKFDNLGIALQVTEDQQVVDARYQEALKARAERKDRIDAETVLKDIDAETLQKLLDAARQLEQQKQ